MNKTFAQILSAFSGPLLTLGCTLLVVRAFAVREETGKALGAAAAGVALLLAERTIDWLPKKWAWWRRRFDTRAAFEGWWLQVHEDQRDRAAVFSFLYDPEGDTFKIEGYAFGPDGSPRADWHSTKLFFSTGDLEVTYLFKGKVRITTPGDGGTTTLAAREGTTTMHLERYAGQPTSGTGEVRHLMEATQLDFRLVRVDAGCLQKLGLAFPVESLSDFDRRKELAVAFLRHGGGPATRAAVGSEGVART